MMNLEEFSAAPRPIIYRVIGRGSVGPAHPLFDPQCDVYVDGCRVHVADSGREAHRWALEQGYELPADDPRRETPSYKALEAEVRYRRAGL